LVYLALPKARVQVHNGKCACDDRDPRHSVACRGFAKSVSKSQQNQILPPILLYVATKKVPRCFDAILLSGHVRVRSRHSPGAVLSHEAIGFLLRKQDNLCHLPVELYQDLTAMRVSWCAKSIPRDVALYGSMTQMPVLTRHRLLADVLDCDRCTLAAEALDLPANEPNKYSLVIPGICLAARRGTPSRCVRRTSLYGGLTEKTKAFSQAIEACSNVNRKSAQLF